MNVSLKVKLLNKLLASDSAWSAEIFADASSGVDAALGANPSPSISEFAKRILPLYSQDAAVEVLDFSYRYFDPLFAAAEISRAITRISGYARPILVVASLEMEGARQSRNHKPFTKLRQSRYAENIDFIEGYAERYKSALPNLEIIFI